MFVLVVTAEALLFSDAARADQLCGQSFESLPQLIMELQSRGDGIITRTPIHVFINNSSALWAFATESQPAYPAAVCLQYVQNGVNLQIRCTAEKAACNKVQEQVFSHDWRRLFE
jgi:hypothetical protein